MRGLDGNYINTQGDALARMQLAYQAEQNRQQIRAQLETADELRKLREEVNAAEKKDATGGPSVVKDDQGASSQGQAFEQEMSFGQGRPETSSESKEEKKTTEGFPPHIDIRV